MEECCKGDGTWKVKLTDAQDQNPASLMRHFQKIFDNPTQIRMIVDEIKIQRSLGEDCLIYIGDAETANEVVNHFRNRHFNVIVEKKEW